MKNSRKRTDFIANKTMFVFALAIVGILGLVGINRAVFTAEGYIAMQSVSRSISWAAIVVGAAGLIGAIIWMVHDSKRETPEMRYFSGVDLAVISLLILTAGILFLLFDALSVIRVLYIMFPACAVLYLVYSLLPRIFFLQTLLCGCSLLALKGISQFFSSPESVFRTVSISGREIFITCTHIGRTIAILGILLALLFGVFFLILRRADGKFARQYRLIPAGENYLPAFLTVLVTIVLFVLAFILLSSIAASILLYILCGYLFILTVYYIVKLM